VLDEFETVHVVVANAGVNVNNLAVSMSDEERHTVIDTNLSGAFYVCRHFLSTFLGTGFGRIILISSIGAHGVSGQANYAASKAGLIGFTKSVAREYASRNVLANCVAPGFIATDMTAALPGEARDALLGQIALGRLGEPAEIAGVVLFLASDLASYITGQVLVVDGGMVI
jgi:3-oxoacyl-[acyl-carrier protein] reductase